MWRAIRHGLDGRLLDLDRFEEEDARAAVERLVAWSAPARRELGLADPAFPERNSAQRQKALIAEGLSPREVYAATVQETQSYAQEARTA